MERIRITSLAAGQVFTQNLYSVSGQKLLGSNVPLTETHVELIQRCGEMEVILAEGSEDLVVAGILRRFDSTQLAVGQRLRGSLVSSSGNLLLEQGQEIEPHHLDAVAAGGRAFLVDKPGPDPRRERLLMADALVDELLADARALSPRVAGQAGASWIKAGHPARWPQPAQLFEYRAQAVESLRLSYARIEAGLEAPGSMFDPILDGLLDRLGAHPTRFTQLALLCPRREDYLPDHAVTVCVLAMSIAGQLHWAREDVRQVGLAALIFDLGMLLVPERIRIGATTLTDVDRARVHRHPVFSVAMAKLVSDIPVLVRLAALQHHERENGSGYPRGSRRDTICDLARVLAVADVFAAATEARGYRRPKLPYIAMEETLRAASLMALWKPAARALVQAAGLFPVGSYVRLSDGRNAHVICADPVHIDRPQIRPLGVDGRAKGDIIDLATVPPEALAVVRPIATATG
jgi:HD-GYP domain-containing protein (c-di-GMP phosphodiesterase class II)